jgi:replicative DNA helicase
LFSETVPPHALESEQYVLGAMILSPIGHTIAIQQLEPDDFYSRQHADIYRTLKSMDCYVDLLTLKARLDAEGIMERIGGFTTLTNCTNTCLYPDRPDPHVAIVKDRSHRRRLIKSLMESQVITADEVRPVDEVQSEVERLIFGVRLPPKDESTVEEWVSLVASEAELVQAGVERKRVRTGIYNLDESLRLYPKQMTILAGATSHGKTATTLMVALNAAIHLGQRTYFWSGEMDKAELWERMFAAELSIRYEDVQERRLNTDDLKRMREFAAKVKASPITVRDHPMTAQDIRADARHIALTEGPIELIVVDYLSLMKELNSEAEGSDRRDVRIGIICWNLIQCAKELNAHVILLHQFNRDKDKRGNAHPRISDLKDSSTIEQHAHNVCLIYRPERDESISNDDKQQYRDKMEFIIGKARGGKVGSLWLSFIGAYQQVLNLVKSLWPSPVAQPDKQTKRKV